MSSNSSDLSDHSDQNEEPDQNNQKDQVDQLPDAQADQAESSDATVGVPRYIKVNDAIPFKDENVSLRSRTLPFYISSDIRIAVNIYSLIKEMKKPSPIEIRKIDGKVLKKETVYRRVDTNVPVESTNLRSSTNVAGEQVTMENSELIEIRSNKESGFWLLGFKPKEAIKNYHYVCPGYYLYPNENNIKGSSKFYSALHNRCLAQSVVAIVKGVLQKNSVPRLMAFFAIEDELLSGFYAWTLPYADDLRPVSIPTLPRYEDAKLKNSMQSTISRLTRTYSPDVIRNPVLQKFWSHIQSLSPFVTDNNDSNEMMKDMTNPSFHFCESIVSKCLGEIVSRLPKDYYCKPDTNLLEVWKRGELNGVTRMAMKEYIQENRIPISINLRKADMSAALRIYFGKIEKD